MDKESLKILVEQEMRSTISERQEKLIEGLVETYTGLKNLGLDSLSIIYRSGIQVSVKNQYQQYMATTRKEELEDKFLLSVFCLVLSRSTDENIPTDEKIKGKKI